MNFFSFFLFLSFFFFSYNCWAQSVPIITTVAGNGTSGYSGDGMSATTAQLKNPWGLAVDTIGNIYIGDLNWVIRKVNTAGIITTFAGNDTLGFSGDGGPATAAKISRAAGIAPDRKGNIYFCDAANYRIRKVDTAGIITTFAGNGYHLDTGNGGPATNAGLSAGVEGVFVDNIGNVYISTGVQVRKVDTFGIITAYAGNDTSGFLGDGGQATAARLDGDGQIAFDNQGNLYICDNTHIRKVSTSGIISTVAGISSTGYSGDGGPATAAAINETPGVFPDKCGNFYIADQANNRIRMVNDAGIITTVAGNGYGGVDNSGSYGGWTGAYLGDGGPAIAAELYGPTNIYLDKQGSIYFTDQLNNVVRYIHMDSCIVYPIKTAVPELGYIQLSVFPNPVTDELNISGVPQDISYRIYSVTGISMQQGTLQKGNNTLSMRYIAPGVYILEMTGEDGARSIVRVVKE